MSATPMDSLSDRPNLSVAFEIAASGWLAVRSTEIGRLRSQVASAYPGTLSAGLLKQSDTQNLVGLLLLRQLLDENRIATNDCEQWGLVAAARMLNRHRVAESLAKFRENGAWTTSPHLIPNSSLHTQSGILSQALKLHGPNIGAGGMKGSEGDALWAAATLLQGDQLPGVWIVLTGWEKETLDDEDILCQAAAFALRPLTKQSSLPRLTFEPGAFVPSGHHQPFTLESVIDSMRNGTGGCWNTGSALCTFEPIARSREAAA